MRAIDAGTYKVGERLPAERELAVEYDVSRPTVREAIISLEVQGLVEVRLGTSAYVRRKPSQQDQPGFNVTAFELTEARLCFEGEAAALAATHITDEELDELDVLVRRIDRENRSENGKEKADHEFHLLIARATRNAAVLHTIESLWRLRLTSPECTLLFERARDAHVKPVVAEHTAIVKALRSRNPAKAREAMRAHMNAVMESLLFVTEERAVEVEGRDGATRPGEARGLPGLELHHRPPTDGATELTAVKDKLELVLGWPLRVFFFFQWAGPPCGQRGDPRGTRETTLDSFPRTSSQDAEKFRHNNVGLRRQLRPGALIELHGHTQQMTASFGDLPAAGAQDLRDQVAHVQTFEQPPHCRTGTAFSSAF